MPSGRRSSRSIRTFSSQTYAYNLTQPPPKTIRPRANVLIGWCDVYSRCDVLRPLSHPYNRHHYEQIKAWGKIAPRLGDRRRLLDPVRVLRAIPPAVDDGASAWARTCKHFADCGAETFFAEACDYLEPGENFIALKFWLAYQLLVNPHQPAEPLIQTFLDGYYGAAAPAMRRYLAYLTERIDRDAQLMMARSAPHKLAYLDLAFFRTAQELFDEAEAQVAPGSLAARHVQRERFKVDGALLFLWPWLERKLPSDAAMPFDKETVIRRYEAAWRDHTWYHRWYTEDKDERWQNPDGKLRERMVGLFRDPQLPEPFRGLPPRDVADFNWLTFSPITPRQKFVADPDAAGGMAAEPAGLSAILAAEEGAPAAGGGGSPPAAHVDVRRDGRADHHADPRRDPAGRQVSPLQDRARDHPAKAPRRALHRAPPSGRWKAGSWASAWTGCMCRTPPIRKPTCGMPTFP